MKKILGVILTLSVVFMAVFGFAGCNKSFELALVTDKGTIDDKSFNQGSYEGLEKYAKETSKTIKYYRPTGSSEDEYYSQISLAIQGGAKVVVTPGFYFEGSIFKAQTAFPEVKFILVDGKPTRTDEKTKEKEVKITENTLSVFYAEEEAGFLAGYAAVKDGYKKLGFMGGYAVPAVIRYGYGFIQGANYAADEMGMDDKAIEVKYHYTNSFQPKPEIQSKAASWYTGGTEVIFTCGGGIVSSVVNAAQTQDNKYVIGVDVDQSSLSDRIITSAMKGLKKSVYDAVKSIYENKFQGGKSVILGAKDEGVGLPENFDKFKTFKKADYDAIFKKLQDGAITLKKDMADGTQISLADLGTAKVAIIDEQ